MARKRNTGQANPAESGNLPAIPSGEIEPEILEGEVVDESAAVPAPLRPARVVLVVVRHEHARTAGRHVSYIGLGAAVTARRVWDSRTTARYERLIRSAEMTGDHETALRWDERKAVFLNDRHKRRMERRQTALQVFKAVTGAGPVMAVLLILAAIIGVCYYVSLRIWPYRPCRRCEGGGRNAGSNRKRWGNCGKCGGSGRKLRRGARMLTRRDR